ncbi:MAG TPA: sulfite exporter TauE/SafE family protein [Candidatus Portnoybacteria bacterium]|nr:sulfite exporter TauE/SafE family protein [Candidatus Portnoybacteria bacterium]
MVHLIIVSILIFLISVIFSIFGKGGGELYLPVMISLLPIAIHEAAGVSLFIIFIQSLSMVAIYHHKHRLIDWGPAIIMALIVGIFAFAGGYFASVISPIVLKILFAILLILSSFFLFVNKKKVVKEGIFTWKRKIGDFEYDWHLLYTLIPLGIIALLAGMVGISGGGLIVPLCVLLGGMPLRVAMGTNTFLVLISSSTGFLGHFAKAGINWQIALILGTMVLVGSQIGSRLHIGIKEKHLRIGLSLIEFLAAGWMIIKIFI